MKCSACVSCGPGGGSGYRTDIRVLDLAVGHYRRKIQKDITRVLAWTRNTKLGIDGSLMVANDVSIPRKCFDKIPEFLKRNWPRAARF